MATSWVSVHARLLGILARVIGQRPRETLYPVDRTGRPDLRYYTDSMNYYSSMHEQYIAGLQRPRRRQAANRSFRQGVHSTWGLIAKGEEAVPYAMGLLRHAVPEAREDGAAILAEIGKDERIVEWLLGCLEEETDATVRDTLLIALGRLRSKKAIPALGAVIRDESTDDDTRWTAVESLGWIVRRRFQAEKDPVNAALTWLANSPGGKGR